MKLRTKFLVVFLLVAILPLVIVAGVTLDKAQQALKTKAEQNLSSVASLKEDQTREAIASYTDQITFIAKRTRLITLMDSYVKTRDPALVPQLNQLLVLVQQQPDSIRTMSVVTTEGTVISSTHADRIGQKTNVNDPPVRLLQPNGQSPYIVLKQPIFQGDIILGYIEFIDQAPELDAILSNYTGLGETGAAWYVQPDGTGAYNISTFRIAPQNDQQQRVNIVTPQFIHNLTQSQAQPYIASIGNTSTLFVMRYLQDLNITIVAKINTDEAFKTINELRDNILIFALVFGLLIIMIILFFVHSITGPISNLAAVASKISGGDLNERALVLSKDEIGNLATTLNSMLDDLQAAKTTLEKKVHERTQQLEATNKELESFSYSVSHDLRAPLRAIDGFSKILVEDYSDKIDNEGKHVIQTIITSTQQMGQLIDDLLAFSRLGRQEVKKQTVNMSAQAHEIYEEVMRLNPDRKITFKVGDLPAAEADASLLRQVWTNLISNAIKFTRKTPHATIEVGATQGKEETTYFVKDNGAGFDMAFVDKLFGVFQRLHDQKDFEGTGVGLAIIQRIITRHGGRVWAEGKVGVGATIYFTIPTEHNSKRRHHG